MRFVFILLTLVFVCSQNLNALDLTHGAVCDRNPETKTDAQRSAGLVISEVYDSYDVDAASCIGWTNLGFGDIWYDFTRDLNIHAIDIESKQYLGKYPLTRWEHAHVEEEIQQRYEESQLDLAPQNRTAFNDRPLVAPPSSIGCLAEKPLRYGDVNQDGHNELVLLLNTDLVVFSPEREDILFSTDFAIRDAYSRDITQALYEDEMGEVQAQDDDPQQVSRFLFNASRYEPREPGYLSLGKVYFGAFSQEDASEVIVWRKLYLSRLLNDPVEGYEFLGNTHLHYVLEDGEYVEQDTDEATIRGWLEEQDLNWSQGYPRYSECEGEEGQLIPEMHDPLLNDPEVLE